MSEEAQNPILTAIDKLVEEKTFNLDALSAIQKLREQAVELDRKLKYAEHSKAELKIERDHKNTRITSLEKELKTWTDRESALRARELTVTELEKSTAVQGAIAQTYATIVDKMFANRVVRENFTESISRPIANGQYGVNYHTETRTETTEKEDKR